MASDAAGTEWRRADHLRPGDVQVFAGRRMRVRLCRAHGRRVVIWYDEVPARNWGQATQLTVEASRG